MDIDDAYQAALAVENGTAPSGSVILAVTGPNSLSNPGPALKVRGVGEGLAGYPRHTPHLHGYQGELDARDLAILDERMAELNAVEGPRCGDWIIFADGVERRISHLWQWGDADDSAQTSDGGSWYLQHGSTSFSGSLYHGVKLTTLTLTERRRFGSVWFFHHDHHAAHNGVDVLVEFRTYQSSEPST